jgi:hypothetical protein
MIPKLIHPIPVEISRMQSGITLLDPVSREPIRQMWRAGDGPGTGSVIRLSAQVNWNEGQVSRPTFGPGGVEEYSLGYLLFKVQDLLSAGVASEDVDGILTVSIARGDRITRIGKRATNLYVLFFRDVAGYDDQMGCTLLEIRFNDRLGA